MAEKEEEIKEAIETLEEISSDEEKERIAELRQKYIMDRKSEIRTAIEKGLKKGEEEGRKKGIEEGKNVGSKEEKIKIAKKLKNMKLKIEDIEKATGLSKEEIEKL